MTDIADMFFVFTLSSNSLDQGDVYVSSEPVSVLLSISCAFCQHQFLVVVMHPLNEMLRCLLIKPDLRGNARKRVCKLIFTEMPANPNLFQVIFCQA